LSRRKREARSVHKKAEFAQKVHGLRAKLYNKQRHAEKIQMKKTCVVADLRPMCWSCNANVNQGRWLSLALTRRRIKMHEERASRQKDNDTVPKGAIPPYLLDREGESRAKVLSNTIKQKRKEKAGKWSVPLPQVKGVAEDEVFKVLTTSKKRSTFRATLPGRTDYERRLMMLTSACSPGCGCPTRTAKQWKRMVTKVTFVGDGFTRKVGCRAERRGELARVTLTIYVYGATLMTLRRSRPSTSASSARWRCVSRRRTSRTRS